MLSQNIKSKNIPEIFCNLFSILPSNKCLYVFPSDRASQFGLVLFQALNSRMWLYGYSTGQLSN